MQRTIKYQQHNKTHATHIQLPINDATKSMHHINKPQQKDKTMHHTIKYQQHDKTNASHNQTSTKL